MKHSRQFTCVALTLLALCALDVMAQQAALPIIQKEEPASQQPSEAQKLLSEIMKERDAGKRAGQLEEFIKDNPDFANLTSAYSSLLTTLRTSNPERAMTLADEILAKYPDPKAAIRSIAYTAEFYALRSQKNEKGMEELGRKILESETSPSLLQSAAASDRANSLKLLEKAIAERQKDPSPTAAPALIDLRWAYAQSLGRTDRKDEALKLSLEVIEAAKKNAAELESLPSEDPQRRRLESARRVLRDRYQTISNMFSSAGQYETALKYLSVFEESAGDNALEGRAGLEQQRAEIYAKMGKPELQMESYARSFAARMDIAMRDKIVKLAGELGKDPEAVFERARGIRKESAAPIKAFELKTAEGLVVTLDSVKSKVTLVNFFFPT